MKITFADVFRWEGTIDRGPYALIGLLGFALKHNLDRLCATLIFHRPWGVFNYLAPLQQAVRVAGLSRDDAAFLTSMVALSLPFIWVGVALTLRRLRATLLPPWFVVLFFVPLLNLLFFAVLCVIPSRTGEGAASDRRQKPQLAMLDRIIPESALGSAAMATGLTVPVGLFLTYFGATMLQTYGLGVFVALPFCMGLASVLLYGYQQPHSLASCLVVSLIPPALLGVGLLLVAMEGIICLIMAAPIGCALSAMGGAVGYLIQRRPDVPSEVPALLSVVLMFAPAVMGIERAAGPEPPVFAVSTAIEIDAPQEAVWRNVVAFADIPQPREWLFRLGIAYPMRAVIEGSGVGAERRCVFSTGAFIEPIEVWDAPRRLKFGVTSNPAPMQEWTPYEGVTPPHLRGFLISRGGEFLLTPLTGGRTRLEGTTWYRHTMWPTGYWRLWSDHIIHQIHLRVLRHIEQQTLAGQILNR